MSGPNQRLYHAGEIRSADNGDIGGYAAVFYDPADPGTEYRMWDDFVERIKPGAFARYLGTAGDVMGLYNHDPSRVLGRRSANTLSLTEDARGLAYTLTPPATETGREVLELVRRRDVTGSSFGFVAKKWEIEQQGPFTVRWLLDVDLFDVSVVTYPAFPGTSADVRAEIEAEIRQCRADGQRRSHLALCHQAEAEAYLTLHRKSS